MRMALFLAVGNIKWSKHIKTCMKVEKFGLKTEDERESTFKKLRSFLFKSSQIEILSERKLDKSTLSEQKGQ